MRLLVMVVSLIGVLLVGCVPADTPPQLAFTPGAPVQIDGREYHTDGFTVRYPAGWRVITSPVESAPSVTFSAPQDTALIFITTDDSAPPALPADAETRAFRAQVAPGLVAHFVAQQGVYEALMPVFESVVESLRVPVNGR